MGKNFLGVFEPFRHLRIGHVQGSVDWILESVSVLIHVGHHLGLRGKNDLCFVAKDNLNDFVGKSKQLGVASLHDFLQINHGLFS